MTTSSQLQNETIRSPGMVNQFYDSIFDSFQNYNIKNAVFLAERLRYVQENDNHICLLAECYLADNAPFKAFSVLKNIKSKRAKYLFAVAAFRINKMSDAEAALMPENSVSKGLNQKIPFDHIVNGSHGLYLLGQICERVGKKQQALECYEKAFQKNPNMFVAFEKVNQLSLSKDVSVNTLNVLRNKINSSHQSTEVTHVVFKNYLNSGIKEKENNISTDIGSNKKTTGNESNFFSAFHQKLQQKPTTKLNNMFIQNQETVNLISSSLKKNSPKSKKKSHDSGPKIPGNNYTESGSLNNSLTQSQLGNIGLNSTSNSYLTQIQNTAIQINDNTSLQDYLIVIGTPYANLQNQNILIALNEFKSLKKPIDMDPWILANIGRCYTEVSNHVEAEKYFKQCFEKESFRTDNADYYSSCLWQLKKQVELSKFAYSMLESHYFVPETWIVHANCYSLAQDHDAAITYLLRAIQIDPYNSYANCLIGHEYVNKENFEKAREFYQKAIKLDPKNVRALFGLGSLELNAGKYQESIEYFINAIKINNQCSTFYTQLGMAYKQKRCYDDALSYFIKSEEINENEKINRFNKADVLFKLGRCQEALRECEKVLLEAKESSVYFLIAQIYQKLGNVEQAHTNFELAIMMDKKEASKIKQCIASLEMREGLY